MRLLKPYLRTLGLVLVISVATNWSDFHSGKIDWKLSFFYNVLTVSLGFAAFIVMNRLYFNKFLDWKLRPESSFLVFILSCATAGALMEAIMVEVKLRISHFPASSPKDYLADILFTAVLFVVVALTGTFRRFVDRWKASIEETTRVEQLLLKSQLESLKNQVNPHFLFNALNTLSSLIRESEDDAVDFLQQLSRILRYSLEQQQEATTTLQSELKIARAYLQIFKQRFLEKLSFEIQVPQELLHKSIVCHSLIMLLENAIKHNEISKDKPLNIRIYATTDYIAVENNLQPRKSQEPSTQIGLVNIRQQYQLIASKAVLTEVNNKTWTVKIPLL